MKLLLALFVVANFGHSQCLSLAQDGPRIKHELDNIVAKYRYLSNGNIEFSQWIDRIYDASRVPNTESYLQHKSSEIWQFRQYDQVRQSLEDQLHRRENEIDGLLADRNVEGSCRRKLRALKKKLEKSYKLSNLGKQIFVNDKKKDCHDFNDDDEDDEDDDDDISI